ncbi:hypothetical protein SRB5_01690 [Streptomyces sp. RB5]|uniref:Proteinase inhibitor I42 chagasin domain-containing protein n=1 Tax=Streptomyces smaragdinus TaxID=2585196 RepID=A0A7K0C9C7_9ACTN|nr:protease inhibitor I42 family protein [Streptomyces smaragdinus]MQY10065.1 hypothetical protein [Streptomyces smaragdinus]
MRILSSSPGSGALALAVVLLTLVVGCGGPDGGPTSHPVEDTSIAAEPGERFTLTVSENASTREYWYLVDPAPDRAVLTERGHASEPQEGKEDWDGAPQDLTFTFEAEGEGVTRFTLLHCTFTTCPPHAKDHPPEAPDAERITYTVTVG